MWILLWVALVPNAQKMETYHIGTFATKSECAEAFKPAIVLVSDNNQTLDCIWIDLSIKPQEN